MVSNLSLLQWTEGLLLVAAAYFLLLCNKKNWLGACRIWFFLAAGVGLAIYTTDLAIPEIRGSVIGTSGRVFHFHQVSEYRSSHYEFQLRTAAGNSPVLKADYFDKGFYFGDSVVNDGDVLDVHYLNTTGWVTHINVVDGKHRGWKFERERSPTVIIIFGVLAIFLLFKGLTELIVDRMIRIT